MTRLPPSTLELSSHTDPTEEVCVDSGRILIIHSFLLCCWESVVFQTYKSMRTHQRRQKTLRCEMPYVVQEEDVSEGVATTQTADLES